MRARVRASEFCRGSDVSFRVAAERLPTRNEGKFKDEEKRGKLERMWTHRQDRTPALPLLANGERCLCPCLFSSSSRRTSFTLVGDGGLVLPCDPEEPRRFLFTEEKIKTITIFIIFIIRLLFRLVNAI